jgi:hypothetical protein
MKHGFTLVENVLYLGLFSVFVFVLMGVFLMTLDIILFLF